MRPGEANRGADKRPVLVPDLAIELGAKSCGRDRACVPPDGGGGFRLVEGGEMRGGQLLAARLECRFLALVDLLLDLAVARKCARLTASEALYPPHPEERRLRRVSKGEATIGASWFETPLRGSSP